MNRAYVFCIYPNPLQEELIQKTFGCVRFVYNQMLSDKIQYYEETGKNLMVTPARYKSAFLWLKEVDSLALANAQLHLEAAYRNFFRGESVGFPKFKSKKSTRKSYTTNCVNGNIRIEGGFLVLPKLGKVRIKVHRQVPDAYQLKSCTVSQRASGKYEVSILYTYETTVELKEIHRVIGLDYSMTELYVSSEDEHAAYPRYYRLAQDQLARMQRKLSHMEKDSQNYKKQKRRIGRLYEHIANQRKDYLHKKSREIANSWDLVGIENLNMKAMQKALNFGKSVSDNAWGKFVSYLEYKLKEQGKQLIRIDHWYPSSKLCSQCGRKKEDLKLSERVYHCECGSKMDRDYNAAMNIRREALRIALTA